MSAAQAASDLAAVRGMWELAAVLRFLGLFRPHLRLSQLLGAGELEDALVWDPGHEGLLAALHTDLLLTLGSRAAQLGTANWAGALRARLDAAELEGLDFKPARGREAAAYAALPATDR